MSKPSGMCANCFMPGHCCRAFPLSRRFSKDAKPEEVRSWLADYVCPVRNQALPFDVIEPLQVAWEDYDGQVTFRYSCKNLDEQTGRCKDYENRPYACREYVPGIDVLCVHHQPQEGTGGL